MTPSRKSKRQHKPTAKLQEFLTETSSDKEQVKRPSTGRTTKPTSKVKNNQQNNAYSTRTPTRTPKMSNRALTSPDDGFRRSGRTPKMSEKLKNYLDDKEEEKKGKSEPVKKQTKLKTEPIKKQTQTKSQLSVKKKVPVKNEVSVRMQVSQTSLRKSKAKNEFPRQPRVVLEKIKVRRVSPKKSKNVKISKTKKVAPVSTKNAKKRVVKRKLDTRSSPRDAKRVKKNQTHKKIKTQLEFDDSDSSDKVLDKGEEVDRVLRLNKDIMTKLLNFGAEVAEAMANNNHAIFGLTEKYTAKQNPLHPFSIDREEDFDELETKKIISWLDEEEEQRRAYRKRILDSLRSSHDTNMALYTKMLKMLQSVTS